MEDCLSNTPLQAITVGVWLWVLICISPLLKEVECLLYILIGHLNVCPFFKGVRERVTECLGASLRPEGTPL